jgi:hypothetical protein
MHRVRTHTFLHRYQHAETLNAKDMLSLPCSEIKECNISTGYLVLPSVCRPSGCPHALTTNVLKGFRLNFVLEIYSSVCTNFIFIRLLFFNSLMREIES